ncbi:MAG: ATPase [Candidatus Nealsonbacteria bacterium]
MAVLFVTNAAGEKEPFSYRKIYRSAKRAGASGKLAKRIADIVGREAYPGIKTSELFKRIKELLHQEIPQAALRFNIKDAMRKLGPTGFPFEKYIAEILKSLGYQVKINQFLPGHCISSYEIDFVAEKGKTIYVGECKYKQAFGERVHYIYALANYARFLDILNGRYFKSNKYRGYEIKTMMATNTKFTSTTLDYARCVGIDLLGWNYPKGRGLEYLIDREGLYPITILPSLKGYLKDIFIREKIMLVKDVLKIDPQKFARNFRIPVSQIKLLVEQAKTLLK